MQREEPSINAVFLFHGGWKHKTEWFFRPATAFFFLHSFSSWIIRLLLGFSTLLSHWYRVAQVWNSRNELSNGATIV